MALAGQLIEEVHGHLDVQAGVLAHTQEVDMLDEIAHRFELVGARQYLVLFTVDIDGDDVTQKTAVLNTQHGVLVGQRDGNGGFMLAVDHGRNPAFTTQLTSGPLAHPLPRRSLQLGRSHWNAPIGLVWKSAPLKYHAPILQG
jgi:hypothetical protein